MCHTFWIYLFASRGSYIRFSVSWPFFRAACIVSWKYCREADRSALTFLVQRCANPCGPRNQRSNVLLLTGRCNTWASSRFAVSQTPPVPDFSVRPSGCRHIVRRRAVVPCRCGRHTEPYYSVCRNGVLRLYMDLADFASAIHQCEPISPSAWLRWALAHPQNQSHPKGQLRAGCVYIVCKCRSNEQHSTGIIRLCQVLYLASCLMDTKPPMYGCMAPGSPRSMP